MSSGRSTDEADDANGTDCRAESQGLCPVSGSEAFDHDFFADLDPLNKNGFFYQKDVAGSVELEANPQPTASLDDVDSPRCIRTSKSCDALADENAVESRVPLVKSVTDPHLVCFEQGVGKSSARYTRFQSGRFHITFTASTCSDDAGRSDESSVGSCDSPREFTIYKKRFCISKCLTDSLTCKPGCVSCDLRWAALRHN